MSMMNRYIVVFIALLIACMSISFAADVNSTDVTSIEADTIGVETTDYVDTQLLASARDDNAINENKNIKQDDNTLLLQDNQTENDNLSTSQRSIKTNTTAKMKGSLINTSIGLLNSTAVINAWQ